MAASNVASTKPWACSIEPVRPSSCSIAIGMVSPPERDRRLVAPNSPSEMAAANAPPAARGLHRNGTIVARHAFVGEAPRVAAASVIVGSTERSTPTQVRTTNGTAISAWPTGTNHHDARQSTGPVSNVISIPNPIVTAEVASGNISPPSSARPARPAATIPRLASAPMTTAIDVAHAALTSELAMASMGSTPTRMPGRISARPRLVHAAVDHPVGVAKERTTSATNGVAAISSVAPATMLTKRRSPPRRGRRRAATGSSPIAWAWRRWAMVDHHTRTRQYAELQQCQHCGTADVTKLCRSSPHLDFDRAGPWRGEDADHAVGGEGEQEHDRCRRSHRGTHERQRDPGRHLPSRSAQRRSGGLHVGRQVLPQRPDNANDDSQVEHDVRTEDRPHRAVERVGEQREERRAHHDRRQYEHRREQRRRARCAHGNRNGQARTPASTRSRSSAPSMRRPATP